MSKVFVIGIGTDPGTAIVSHGASPDQTLVEAVKGNPGAAVSLAHVATYDRAAEAELVFRIVGNFLPTDGGGVASMIDVVRRADELYRRGAPTAPMPGDIFRRLRTEIFRVPMAVMGQIAGVSEGQVSKWESGAYRPGWIELARLRAFAIAARLDWSDALLFD